MSRIFSMKNGSVESLKLRLLCGCTRKRLKHAMHGGFGNAAVVGGLANTPMGSPGGLAGEGTFEQDGNLLIGNAAWPPRPQLIVQTRHTLFEETLSPLAHRDLGPAQTLSNLGIALALGRPQHYFSAADERMRQAYAKPRDSSVVCVRPRSVGG